MSWIEIIRLIIRIWPLIEHILGLIEEGEKREEAEQDIAKIYGSILQNKNAVV